MERKASRSGGYRILGLLGPARQLGPVRVMYITVLFIAKTIHKIFNFGYIRK